MTEYKPSRLSATLCFMALLLLVPAKAGPEEQPGSFGNYTPASENVVRKLLNVARKACRGTSAHNEALFKALNLNGPTYYYREQPAAEIALIPARYCPEPSPTAELVVGRLEKGKSFYFKILPLTAKPIVAAVSFFDPARHNIVYEPIALTRELHEICDALIGFLTTFW
jgi:hypothetical protein